MGFKDTLIAGAKITGAATAAGFGWEMGRSLWKLVKWGLITLFFFGPLAVSCARLGSDPHKPIAAKPIAQKQHQRHVTQRPVVQIEQPQYTH